MFPTWRWFAAIVGPPASSTAKWRKARKCAFAQSAKNLWISKGREERTQHGSENKRTIPEGSRAGLGKGIQLRQRERRSAPAEDRGQHGPGGSHPERQFQAAEEHAYRGGGDFAWRPHVRVLRPPDQRRHAARSRFSRRLHARVRRPGKLHAGTAGPVGISGD